MIFPEHVQSAKNGNAGADAIDSGTATTIACAFGANVTAGHHLLAIITWGDSVGSPPLPTSVQDGIGNTLTLVRSDEDGPNRQSLAVYLKTNCVGGASTITATWAASQPWRGIIVAEYAGLGALFRGLGTIVTATGALSISSGGILIPNYRGILIGYCSNTGSSATQHATAPEMTIRQHVHWTDTGEGVMLADRLIHGGPTPMAARFTPPTDGAVWLVGGVAFVSANPHNPTRA